MNLNTWIALVSLPVDGVDLRSHYYNDQKTVIVKMSDLLSSEYVVIVYLFMYYYVNVSVLLCGVAVWCLMYFWVITIICLFYFW